MAYIENLISGMLPFCLLIFCGILISVYGKFFQFTKLFASFKLCVKAFREKGNNKKGISSFQSACTALSATVGTGNIAGVAGAVALGGAGAVLWMWVSAFLGMAIKFAEVKFSVIYREKQGEEYMGGPMYYIKNGLPRVFGILSLLFCFFCIPAVFFTGNITQVNAAASLLSENKITHILFGVVFAILTAIVIWGGNKRIGLVTEKVVPIMSVIYILLSFGVIIKNFEALPEAFGMIFKGAFSPEAVTGGAVGSCFTVMFIGASRGVFSNEAGLGTSAMAHSAAYDAKADTQGLFGIFEVFVDTVVICTITALTILCSGVNIEYGRIASSELVSSALSFVYGDIAIILLIFMMSIFAFSSVIGWAFYGNICSKFLFGKKGVVIFKVIYPVFCLLGAVLSSEIPWRMSSFLNGLMLIINLPVLLILWNKKGEKSDRKITGKIEHR